MTGSMFLVSALGVLVLLGLAWLLSENRRQVHWRTIAAGVGLQFVLAISLLRIPALRGVFLTLNRVMDGLTNALATGTSFVFGYLGGGEPPFAITDPANGLPVRVSVACRSFC